MKVFFYQRSTHRKRQQETVEHCPDGIEKITPEGLSFVKDTVLSARKRDKKLNFKSRLSKFAPLNTHKMPKEKVEQADYVYTWGCIPRGTKKPYVLEMDNPYCICYYNMGWFNVLKPLWKQILKSKRLRQIVCISEACKKSIQVELGEEITKKVSVVYPYIEKHEKVNNSDNSIVEFLFVSTQFYLKGGREVVEAFKAVYASDSRVHLTAITHLKEVPQEYRNLPFCTFIEANLDKKMLHNEYFSRADVFILPSYQDSFGMVYLEALSFGLPIIATNMYAIPEMVKEGENGYMIKPPVLFYLDDYKLNPEYRNRNILDDIKAVCLFDDTVTDLILCIQKLLDDELRKKMSMRSQEIFNEKFSKEKRDKDFRRLFV